MKCKLSTGFLKRDVNRIRQTTELPAAGLDAPADDADPVTGPIREAIAEAREVGQLDYLLKVNIPHCVGIFDGERAELVSLVWDRLERIKAPVRPVKVDQGCRAVFQGRKGTDDRGHHRRNLCFKLNQG